MKRVAVAVIGVLVVGIIPGLAAAQSASDVTADLRTDGYYIDPAAASMDPGDLRAVHRESTASGHPVYPVILARDPVGGADGFAQLVMDSLDDGTVVVLTDSLAVGAVSLQYDTAALDRALDEADAVGGDNLTYLQAFTAALANIGGAAGAPGAGGGGGGSAVGLFLLIAVVAVFVVAVVFVIRRSRRDSAARRRRRIRQVLDEMANDILDLSDRVEGNPEAEEHYVEGSAGYSDAVEKLERAGEGDDLAGLMRPLLESAWHLDAAEALVEGAPVPPRPVPAPFPTGSGMEVSPPASGRMPTAPAGGVRAARVLSMLGGLLGSTGPLPARRRPSMLRHRRRSAATGIASRVRRGAASLGRVGRRRRR